MAWYSAEKDTTVPGGSSIDLSFNINRDFLIKKVLVTSFEQDLTTPVRQFIPSTLTIEASNNSITSNISGSTLSVGFFNKKISLVFNVSSLMELNLLIPGGSAVRFFSNSLHKGFPFDNVIYMIMEFEDSIDNVVLF